MASDFLDDLSKATAIFRQGTQGLALQQALTNANEEVQRIKNTTKDANQLRSETYAVAQGLTLKMLGIGADPQTVAAASQGIMGPQAATAEQAVLLGQQTGQQSLWDQGQALIAQQQKQKLEQQDNAGNWQLKNIALQGNLAFRNALAGKEAKLVPTEIATKITDLNVTKKSVDNLLKMQYDFGGGANNLNNIPLVGKAVQWGRSKTDPNFIKFKQALETNYMENKLRLTGSAGSEKELEAIKEMTAAIDQGPTAVRALLQGQAQMVADKYNTTVQSYQSLGFNLGQVDGGQQSPADYGAGFSTRSAPTKQQAQEQPQVTTPTAPQAAPPVVDQRPVTPKSDNQLMQEDLALQPLAGSGVRDAAVDLINKIKSNRKTVAEQKKEQLRQAEEARKERVRKLREGRGAR